MGSTNTSLGGKALAAVTWGAGGAVVRLLLQFGSQVMLARLLGPTEYGLFAIGAIVVSFSAFFSDVGIAYGLIQKQEVGDRDVRFVFTWQVIFGSLVSLLIYGFAPTIAAFFGNPGANSVVQALAPVCLLNALAAPSLNLMKRGLDFKRIQIAQLLSYLVGYVLVGIPMAWASMGVNALVAAWLVQCALNALILYGGTKHAVQPLIWYEQARTQVAYGGTVFTTNLLNWAINNMDRVFIGRMFPPREIGLYATTYNMLYNPTSTLLGVLQPVFFSTSARLDPYEDRGHIQQGFIALVAAIVCFVLPLFAYVATLAPAFISVLYGDKWVDAAAVCRPVALAMPLFLIWGMATPLLWAGGRPQREFLVQLPVVALWAFGCWLLAPHGIEAMAWGALVLFMLRCGITVVTALRVIKMSMATLWRSIQGGLLLCAMDVLLIVAIDFVLADRSAPLRLLLCGFLSALFHMACLRLMPSIIPAALKNVLARVVARLPVRFARSLGFLTGRNG